MGIENMLKLNDMTMDDIELVEFPYPDDWYDKPEMLVPPMNNPSELWMRRDHKHDLAFRPLETALLAGKVDAIYTQSKVFQHLQEATGQLKMIEDLSRYPDWTIQVANTPAVITCTDVMADEHPELVVAYMKAMIKVGRWANEHKRAAGAILNRQTFYLDAEDTYQGIKDVDMVPSLSAQNLQCVKIGKDFMVSHGYIKNDFDVDEWAAPGVPGAGRRRRCSRRSGSAGAGASSPRAAGSKSKARGSGRHHRRARRPTFADRGRNVTSGPRRHPGVPRIRSAPTSRPGPGGRSDGEDRRRDGRKARPRSSTCPRRTLRRDGLGSGGPPGRPRAGRVGAPHRRRRPGATRAARVRRGPDKPSTQAGARPGPARDRVLPIGRPGRARGLTLKTLGYQDVANLEGGITAWKEAGLPTDGAPRGHVTSARSPSPWS